MARTLALPMCLTLPDFPQIPRPLTTRIEKTTFCLVLSIAASQARLSSSSYALDFAIAGGQHTSWISINRSPWKAQGINYFLSGNDNRDTVIARSKWSHLNDYAGEIINWSSDYFRVGCQIVDPKKYEYVCTNYTRSVDVRCTTWPGPTAN